MNGAQAYLFWGVWNAAVIGAREVAWQPVAASMALARKGSVRVMRRVESVTGRIVSQRREREEKLPWLDEFRNWCHSQEAVILAADFASERPLLSLELPLQARNSPMLYQSSPA